MGGEGVEAGSDRAQGLWVHGLLPARAVYSAEEDLQLQVAEDADIRRVVVGDAVQVGCESVVVEDIVLRQVDQRAVR